MLDGDETLWAVNNDVALNKKDIRENKLKGNKM